MVIINYTDARARAALLPEIDLSTANKVGIGQPPTAVLHIKAGTTAALTAPLKLTSGSLNTVSEAGAVEFLTDDLYFTQTTNTSRHLVAWQDNPIANQIFS